MGPVERPGVEAQRPDGQHRQLVANGTRIWVYCGDGKPSDLDAGISAGNLFNAKFLEGFTLRTNKTFQEQYIAAGGKNGVFNFPSNGTHQWSYWGSQLQQMKPDIQRVLGAVPQPSAPVAAASCGGRRLRRPATKLDTWSTAAIPSRGSPPSAISGAPLRADVVVYAAGTANDVRWGRCVGLSERSLTVALAAGLWTASSATANADVEMLMVPSAAMGRDIPVAFQAGGPHAVVLLDAFNAAPDVSNWVTAGNAMNTLAGSGHLGGRTGGGAWSLYTNWEQDGSRQWETFLADELPNWLAANKGLAPSGHGIVGAAQGGTGAMTIATFHPDRYRYAGSLSGFLTP